MRGERRVWPGSARAPEGIFGFSTVGDFRVIVTNLSLNIIPASNLAYISYITCLIIKLALVAPEVVSPNTFRRPRTPGL